MDEIHPNPGPTEEIIKEEDLKIDLIDDESVEGADNERAELGVMMREWGTYLGPKVNLARGRLTRFF